MQVCPYFVPLVLVLCLIGYANRQRLPSLRGMVREPGQPGRLAGLAGQVRAQEDAGQRKWEEMNQLARLLSPKAREREQTKFPQVFIFTPQPAKTVQTAK